MNQLRSLAVVGMALFAMACAGAGGRGASDAERRQYQAALNTAKENPLEGTRMLSEFLSVNPRSSLADDAAAQLAELSLQAADEKRAMEWLYVIVRDYPNEDTADRARVLLAGMEGRAGHPRKAQRLLAKVRFDKLNSAERRLAFRLYADLSDDPVERLGWQVRERTAVVDELKDAEYESPVLGGGLDDLEGEIAASVDAMSDQEAGRFRGGEPTLPKGRVSRVDDRRPDALRRSGTRSRTARAHRRRRR
ncbi:MAG: hypothetical protein JRG94_20605 [Deltaproteobacteria bacterium]|nr:hypothetical protein [Deltaproteobacteria bacterium]